MDRIDKSKLIHPAECFQRAEFERRQAEYHFAHLSKIEAFAWDLEMFGQLQRHFNDRVVLKGGAAAQLYFPISLQRNSVDIDVITDLSVEEFESGLEIIANDICPTGAVCKFTRYTPKEPKEGLRVTKYEVRVPSVCPPETTREPGVLILTVDVLYGKLPSACCIDSATRTFALDLAFAARLITVDALFGDKLLTLASTTVGIPEERANDRCKQLYDLYRLADLDLLRNSAEIQDSFKDCMEIQHQISGQRDISLMDAVIDVENFLQKARLLDSDDPLKLNIALKSFQSNFVGKDARPSREAWLIGIEKIRLLVEGLLAQEQGSATDPIEVLGLARVLEQVVQGDPSENGDPDGKRKHVERIQAKLRAFCESKKISPRTIRGRSPSRAFWYLVTHENIRELDILLKD